MRLDGKTAGLPWWAVNPQTYDGNLRTYLRKQRRVGAGKCPYAQKLRLQRLPMWLRPGFNITRQQWRAFLKKLRNGKRRGF